MSQGDDWLEGGGTNPRPPGMSSGTKVLLGVLFFAGFCAVICCGVIAYFGFQFKKSVETTDDPVVVAARAQEIAGMQIPARFKPTASVKFDLFKMKYAVTTFQTAAKDGSLTILELQAPFEKMKGKADGQQQVREFEEQMRQNGGAPQPPAGPKPLDVEGSEIKVEEREIRGQKVKVTFTKGTDPKTKTVLRQAVLIMPGKTPGTSVLITLQLPESEWDEEEIRSWIESIK